MVSSLDTLNQTFERKVRGSMVQWWPSVPQVVLLP